MNSIIKKAVSSDLKNKADKFAKIFNCDPETTVSDNNGLTYIIDYLNIGAE